MDIGFVKIGNKIRVLFLDLLLFIKALQNKKQPIPSKREAAIVLESGVYTYICWLSVGSRFFPVMYETTCLECEDG